MRVLFTTWAWRSHLYVMVPLAWACRSAGHEVLVASQPALRDELERTGLPTAVVGSDVDAVELVRGYVLPANAASRASGGSAPTGRQPRALQMFSALAAAMTDDLVTLTRDWRADLVVFEPTALAGPVAAAAAGVPAVRHLYGVDLMTRARPVLPEVLAPLASRHGVEAPEPLGAATIDPTPPSLQVSDELPRLPMRYVPYNGAGSGPAPLPPPGDRPRVCITWGHTMAKLGPQHFLVNEIVAALDGLDTEVVVVVSDPQAPLLGELPAGTRVLIDAPLHQVVGGCDLVIAHGGAGTLLTALSNGIPVLLVPQLPDHAAHGARAVAAGVGAMLTRDEATPQRLREEIQRLLADGPQRAAARLAQAEMAALPTPASRVADLVAVADRVMAH